MKKQLLRQFCLISLFTISACQFQPTTPQLSQLKPSQSQSHQAQFKTGSYRGPVTLKINTGLSQNTPGKIVDLNTIANGFRVQSVPEGTVVFSETIRSGRKKELFKRNFTVTDTSKRYTLHIEKHSRWFHTLHHIAANLNGSTVIRANDFKLQPEFETSGLLLNGQNSLQIEHQGIPGTEFTITIVETGSSGTLLRRRGWEKDQDLTQADRLRNNDTNIFYPDDPDSLGDLKPYEGDTAIQQGDQTQYIGLALANQTRAKLIIGQLTTIIKSPVAQHIAELENRFPIKVVSTEDSFGDTFAKLEIEMDQVELTGLASTVQTLNQREDYLALNEILFSSINTAKTFSVASDIQAYAEDLTWGVGVVQLGEKHAAIDFNEQQTELLQNLIGGEGSYIAPSTPLKASELWWLNSIKVRDAWNYSLGSDSLVAVVDAGFDIIQDNADFKGRVKLAKDIDSNRVSYLSEFCDLVTGNCDSSDDQDRDVDNGNGIRLFNAPGHGLAVASFLAAEHNNKEGIVGVAPGATLLPMFSSGEDIENALSGQLERLYSENVPVDVVNFSSGKLINAFDLYLGSFLFNEQIDLGPQNTNKFEWTGPFSNVNLGRLMRIIGKLSLERKVVFVCSGGNQNLPQYNTLINGVPQLFPVINFPAALPYVIAVGAYEQPGNTKEKANFTSIGPNEYKDPVTNQNLISGSNYGPYIDIWAPGRFMWMKNPIYNPDLEQYIKHWDYWEGTSHATPLVSGAVAMIKSANKSLGHDEVLQILRESGERLTDSSFVNIAADPYSIYGLNSLAAIQHPLVGAKQAKKYSFKITGTPGNLALEDSSKKVPGASSNTPHLVSMKLKDFGDYPALEVGNTVEILGWTKNERNAIANSTIEVLQLSVQDPVTGGLNLSSINPVPASAIPGDFGVRMFFDPGLNGELVLRGGDYFGLFMLHQQYTNLRVEIQGQEAVITTPSNDFVKVRVPVGLAIGNHDILFKSDQGEFKLENAINYTSPYPQVVTLSKPAVFTNGVDTVDVTVKVEDANGNPAPDGSAYYVSLLGRNYTGNIINPDTGQQYGYERALPVSNGEIRFKVNSSYNVSPWEYTYNYSTSSFDAFTWPNPAAPSVQVRLCKAAYSSSKPGYGYYCAEQLFPQSGNTQEGRIYHVSAYEHNPLIVNVSANGPRQEVVVNNLRDPLGNPLPEGTPVYMRQIIGGSGLLSREDGTSSSVMSFLSDTNGSVSFWYSPGPISCFSNGNGQDAISPLFASPTQVFGPSNPKEWLVGSPIIFRYPGC